AGGMCRGGGIMKFAVAFVVLAACAAGHPLPVSASAPGAFPSRSSTPDLPTVRSMSARWVAMEALSARVSVCVTPVGETALVRLERSSGDSVFDAAIVEDVGRWRYEPAPATMCERATVTFVP